MKTKSTLLILILFISFSCSRKLNPTLDLRRKKITKCMNNIKESRKYSKSNGAKYTIRKRWTTY